MTWKRGLKWALVPLALAGLVALSRTDAVAQIRATLIKNIDEPGRIPLEIRAVWLHDRCLENCSNFSTIGVSTNWLRWEFFLPAVPAGKRWVVQHVSGVLPGTGTTASVELDENLVSPFGGGKWTFYGPFFVGQLRLLGFNSQVFTTYGPSASPRVRVAVTDWTDINPGVISVSGYLIDAVN